MLHANAYVVYTYATRDFAPQRKKCHSRQPAARWRGNPADTTDSRTGVLVSDVAQCPSHGVHCKTPKQSSTNQPRTPSLTKERLQKPSTFLCVLRSFAICNRSSSKSNRSSSPSIFTGLAYGFSPGFPPFSSSLPLAQEA